MSGRRVKRSIDHLFREQAGQVVATLTRIFGPEHLELAEEVVQDAFIRALKTWPFHGIPDNPRAWILKVARHRALDQLRRLGVWRRKRALIEQSLAGEAGGNRDQHAFAGELSDDRLRLVFLCCHPALNRDAQVALTLKTACGFGSGEIARAFLVRESTVKQRLVRGKARLRQQCISFEIPSPDQLPDRLGAVMEVLYLMFNEGYAAYQGDQLVRIDMCHEAMRLGELLAAESVVDNHSLRALLALFYFQASRLPAREGVDGEVLRLIDQDRSCWDRALIKRGLVHLQRATGANAVSAYHLQADIASCHVAAADYSSTDWQRIVSAYDRLMQLDPSPVVALNRAIALAEFDGPEAGLAALDALDGEAPPLARYYPFFVTRGELLLRVGRTREAAACFRHAIGLTQSRAIQRELTRRFDNIEQ